MDYERRNISLPPELNKRLKTEGNASGTIVDALTLYYGSKDGARRVVALADELNRRLDELTDGLQDLEVIKRDVREIKQLAGGYRG